MLDSPGFEQHALAHLDMEQRPMQLHRQWRDLELSPLSRLYYDMPRFDFDPGRVIETQLVEPYNQTNNQNVTMKKVDGSKPDPGRLPAATTGGTPYWCTGVEHDDTASPAHDAVDSDFSAINSSRRKISVSPLYTKKRFLVIRWDAEKIEVLPIKTYQPKATHLDKCHVCQSRTEPRSEHLPSYISTGLWMETLRLMQNVAPFFLFPSFSIEDKSLQDT